MEDSAKVAKTGNDDDGDARHLIQVQVQTADPLQLMHEDGVRWQGWQGDGMQPVASQGPAISLQQAILCRSS